jgi:glycosyltransferase involved in cell wall biosynthesis
MLLSIIVPVYNSAATLERSIGSLVKHAGEEIEVVCIDDASTDGSFKKLLAYSALSPHVRIYKNERNLGVSATRNRGITLSRSEWVTFVDSDDELIEKTISQIKALLSSVQDVDAIIFSHVTSNGISPTDYGITEGEHDRQSICAWLRYYLVSPEGNSLITHAWAKIYNKNVLLQNKIFFDEQKKIYEDLQFVVDILTAADRIIVKKLTVYKYYESSGLGAQYHRNPMGYQLALEKIAKYCESKDLYQKGATVFFAKTLYLARTLEYTEFKDMMRRGSREINFDIDVAMVKNHTIRQILKYGVYKYYTLTYILIRLVA